MIGYIEKTENTCQLTSRHAVDDVRILHRMALSLKRAGYASNVAGPNDRDDVYKGIQLIAIAGNRKKRGIFNRLKRIILLIRFSFSKSCSAYQIHDPDLLVVGVILKIFGKHVIYDVHDDYEARVINRLSKRPLLASVAAKFWWIFEKNVVKCFDGIVVADRHLAGKFKGRHPVILGNFPRLNFTNPANTSNETTFNIIYVGGVDQRCGIGKIIDAIDLLPQKDIRFHIIGECRDTALATRIQASKRILHFGRVPWTDLHPYYTRAHMGVALYQPTVNFLYCPGENSVKIIEYMAAGIPVLCSDFPGLKTFVEEPGYGLTVQPDDPQAIAEKIRYLYKNPDDRATMGANGRQAFEKEYNWEKHESKLIALYERISNSKGHA